MHHPELDTPIGTLLLMRPKTVAVLRGAGIPLERDHGLTLLEACNGNGLNPYAVVKRIHRAERGPSGPEIEALDVGACIRRALPRSSTPPLPS